MPDHHARADRLRDFIESLSKVRDECLDEAEVDLDGEVPQVPKRYAVSEWDGNETYIHFADTEKEANAIGGDLGGGDYPWSPGEMMDLDTGVTYEPHVTCKYTPMRYVVNISHDESNRVFKARFTRKNVARKYIADSKRERDGYTVLDDEPVDLLAAQ